MITHAPNDLSALDDVRLAAALATGAGDVLLGLRRRADADRRTAPPSTPGPRTSAGRATPPRSRGSPSALAGARPSDSVLSEEAAATPAA